MQNKKMLEARKGKGLICALHIGLGFNFAGKKTAKHAVRVLFGPKPTDPVPLDLATMIPTTDITDSGTFSESV